MASDHHHRAAFALALLPISPALAALHASHIRRVTSEPLTSLTCSRCGHTPVRTRSCRNRKNKHVLERSCAACAFVEAIPIQSTAVAQFKSTRVRRRAQKGLGGSDASPASMHNPSPAATPSPSLTPAPTKSTPPPSLVPAPAKSTSAPASAPVPTTSKRSKKKSGLQELLARNRQRQAQQQRAPSGSSGLTSFLDGL